MKKKGGTLKYLRQNYDMYLLLVPALVYVFIFHLLPMFGILIAFKDYNMFQVPGNPFLSIIESPWAGFKYFEQVFKRPEFLQAFANTLIISVYKIIFTFPLPIIFAVFLNEVRSTKFQKGLRLIVYLPHFLSWVVLATVVTNMFSLDGPINSFLNLFGIGGIQFLADNSWFRTVIIGTDVWKEFGYNSVIYLAALLSIDPGLYEAASIDGAGRFKQIMNITLPSLMPTVVLMVALSLGNILNAGFDQVFNLYNPIVYETGDIIDTYVYRIGMVERQYSIGAAVGLFKSIISFALILGSNKVAKKLTGSGIF